MGARCLIGGKRVNGSFYEPTVLVDVTPDMPVMKDEVFGPVAPVCSFTEHRRGDRDGERFRVRPAVDRLLVEHQQCPEHRAQTGGRRRRHQRVGRVPARATYRSAARSRAASAARVSSTLCWR